MFVGNLVHTGCRWGILVALTQLGSPEMVGAYALAIGLCTPVFTLCNVNLRSVQTIDMRGEFDFGSYLSLRLLTAFLALGITSAVALLSGFDESLVVIILMVGCAKLSESISDVFHGMFQRVERMDYSATSMALNGVVSVAAIALTLYVTHSLLAGMIALAAAWLLLLVAYDFPRGLIILAGDAEGELCVRDAARSLVRSVRAQIRAANTYRLALVALPLGIGTFLCALNINVPRYVIALHIGERELGYFAALASSTIAINLIVRSLCTTMMPTLAKCFATGGKDRFLRHVVRAALLAFVVGTAAVFMASVIGRPLLTFVYGAEYAEYAQLFTGLMVVGTISAIATTLSLATTSARLFRAQALLYGIDSIVIIGACWLLVPRFALWGAVIAIGVAASVRIVLYVFLIEVTVRRKASLLPSS
jgi:O-antigen/teichoic acid export membrane protein